MLERMRNSEAEEGKIKKRCDQSVAPIGGGHGEENERIGPGQVG